MSFFSLFIVATFLTACSADDSSKADSAAGSASLGKAVELSPELVTIFMQDCAQCHTKAATGAPIAGDAEAWRKILSKGIEATLDRTFNGYGGMPPAGRCFECTAEQLTQLIYFMGQGA